MNPFLSRLMHRLHEENNGAGNDLGGEAVDIEAAVTAALAAEAAAAAAAEKSAVVDRGDTVAAPVKDEATIAAEAAAAQKLIDDAAAAEALAKGEKDKPRGGDGKFAKKDGGKGVIPVDRHEAVLNKERERAANAEAALAALQAKINTASTAVDLEKLEGEITTLEEEHAKAMLGGDAKKAAELMTAIRHKERDVGRLNQQTERASETAAQAQARAVEEEKGRVTAVIDDLMENVPEFKEGGEQFNPTLVNLVLARQSQLITQDKLSPSTALRQAADEVLEARGGAKTLTDAEVVDPKGSKAAERKAAAVTAALAAAKAQPGSMKELGLDSDKNGAKLTEEDAAKMTFEEFNALPEATRSKMRGDFI